MLRTRENVTLPRSGRASENYSGTFVPDIPTHDCSYLNSSVMTKRYSMHILI